MKGDLEGGVVISFFNTNLLLNSLHFLWIFFKNRILTRVVKQVSIICFGPTHYWSTKSRMSWIDRLGYMS